jgi:cephalosporin-C deacetylase-like acetyl esterase
MEYIYENRCKMKTTCFKFTSLFALMFMSICLMSQEYKVEVKTDKVDAIYSKGQKITFSAQVLMDGKPVVGKKVNYLLQGDGNLKKTDSFISAEAPFTLEESLDFPGWIQVKFTVVGDDGNPLKQKDKNDKEVILEAAIGAMVAPLEIKPEGDEPKDFDAFWKACRKELDMTPVKAELVKVDVPLSQPGKYECYDVKVDCAGGMPVSGYLWKPVGAKPKSLPAIVSYHSAGVRSARDTFSHDKSCAISFDVNAHGIANGQPGKFYSDLNQNELKDYSSRGKNDRDKFYFKGMYMRVMRALDYVKSLPEWDGKNLIVMGVSQGGAQAIAAAALDPQVTLCLASVPALSELSGTLAKPQRQSGWPRLFSAKDGKPDDETVAKTVAYYDNIFFAKRIKADIYISTGFVDNTCAPTGVFAVFNNIPETTKKFITSTPCDGHDGAPNTLGGRRLAAFFKDLKNAD